MSRILACADEGARRIDWAEREMPVLRQITARFERERPLAGLRIGACLHVTTETANLVRTLAAGGAEVALCASNPLSTQDDVAAALVGEFGISVFARHGADRPTYYGHLKAVADTHPQLTMDDGCDLVSLLHAERVGQIGEVLAGTEETTTGVIRLRAMAADGALRYPVIAVNEALTKHLFDNRYGTGQSTVDGILRATNLLLAGRHVVVAGYGWVGRGIAIALPRHGRPGGCRRGRSRRRPSRRCMDGYLILTHTAAAAWGEVFITATGNIHVFRREHFLAMPDGAILANCRPLRRRDRHPGPGRCWPRAMSAKCARTSASTTSAPKRIHLARRGPAGQPGRGRGPPRGGHGHELRRPGALGGVRAAATTPSWSPGSTTCPSRSTARWRGSSSAALGIELDPLTPEQVEYLATWQSGT